MVTPSLMGLTWVVGGHGVEGCHLTGHSCHLQFLGGGKLEAECPLFLLQISEGEGSHHTRLEVGAGGGYNRGDAEGSGTATAILARRVQELEVENDSLKTQLKETPKKKTLEELDNIKEKSSSLKNKVQTLEENLASKELELFKLVGIKDAIEGFTMGGGSESKTEECILDSCSDRVKKHMKIIISNKLDQDDLKSCLRIIFLRLDGHYSCEEIIRFFAGLDNPMAAVENLAKAPKGVGVCQEDTVEGEDSAPSSESEGEISGEEKKLQP